jgi:hypothetical protein
VVKDKTTFKIFLQNNMDRGIAEISLLAESPALRFEITPKKMRIPKGHRVFFSVTMFPKPNVRTGTYPINFRLVGGGRQYKSFKLKMKKKGKKPVKKEKFEKVKDKSRLLRIKPIDRPPKIDGVLDDKCWKKSAIASNFSSLKGGKAISQTVVLIAFDKKFLYFNVYSRVRPGEEISRDDNVEIRFATNNSGYPYYSFILPASGKPRFKRALKKGPLVSYSPEGVEYGIANNEGFWTAEISIPFSVLEINSPASETVWYMRID